MVVAGVSLDRASVSRLKRLGVRDSKMLTPNKRNELYDKILSQSGRVVAVMVEPEEIDAIVRTGKRFRKLNYLEAVYFARVADELGTSKVIVDASDSSPSRFRDNIVANMLGKSKVLAAHKADRDYAVVSAASIVAKVERDRAIEKLRRTLGDFGSGYPGDPKTTVFFMEKMRKGELPSAYLRKSWKTWNRLQRMIQNEESARGQD